MPIQKPLDAEAYEINTLMQVRALMLAAPIAEWVGILNKIDPIIKVRILFDLKSKHDRVLKSMVRGYKAYRHYDQVMGDHKLDLCRLDTRFSFVAHRLIVPPGYNGVQVKDPSKQQKLKDAFVLEITNPHYGLPDVTAVAEIEDIIMLFLREWNPFIDWEVRHGELNNRDFHKAREILKKLLYGPGHISNKTAGNYLISTASRQPGKLLTLLLED